MNRAPFASLVSFAALMFLTAASPAAAKPPDTGTIHPETPAPSSGVPSAASAPVNGVFAGVIRSVKITMDGMVLGGVVALPELGASATQITIASGGGGGTTTVNSSVRVVPITISRYLSSDAKLEQWANAAMNNMMSGAPSGGTPSTARRDLQVEMSSITGKVVTYQLFACLASDYRVTDTVKDGAPAAMEHLTATCQRLTTQR